MTKSEALRLRSALMLLMISFLVGCIFYPHPQYAKRDAQTYQPLDVITGKPAEESIVRSAEGFGLVDMFLPLTPEGPVNKTVVGGGGFYYYLERDSRRTALPFLRIGDSAETRDPWEAYMSFGGTWLVFDIAGKPGQPVRIVRFRGGQLELDERVHVPQRANILSMHIDREMRVMIFKSRSNDIYRYVLGSKNPPQCIDAAELAPLLPRLVAIPGYESAGGIFDAPEPIEPEIARQREIGKSGAVRTYPDLAAKALRSTDLAELARLSTFHGPDHDYLVRWAVAENPATPRQILERLKDDEATVVVESVNRRLYGPGKGPCSIAGRQ